MVLIEFNRNYAIDEYWTFPNNSSLFWEGDCLFGASLAALDLLSKTLGYVLVYTESASVNAFFLRKDVLEDTGASPMPLSILHPPPRPIHSPCSEDRMKMRVDYRRWIADGDDDVL